MINIDKIKTIIKISEEESKLNSIKNKELNINLNNFLISKIFPDVLFIFKNSNKFSIEENTNSFTIFKNEEYFSINDYKNLGEFLFETYALKNLSYSEHISDVEEHLRDKYENHFKLIINNLFGYNIDNDYFNYLYYLFFNKIQNLDIKTVFINQLEEYELLLNKEFQNKDFKLIKKQFNNLIQQYTSKGNIEINIKCNFNNITLKLKENDREVNQFVIEEILNKFTDQDFNFFIKQSSNFSINNYKIDIVEGYSFFNGNITKLNRKNVEQFAFNKNFIRKTVFK